MRKAKTAKEIHQTRKKALDILTAHGIMIYPGEALASEPRENDAVTTYYNFIKFVMVEQKPKTKVWECYNTR